MHRSLKASLIIAPAIVTLVFFNAPIIKNKQYSVTVAQNINNNIYNLPCNACFKLWLKLTGSDKLMQVGKYTITTNSSYEQLRKRIIAGQGRFYTFTIRAGDSTQEILKALTDNQDILHTGIVNDENNITFVPMTLRYNKDDKDSELLNKAINYSYSKISEIYNNCDYKYKANFLTVASIIAKESAYKPEYPFIAAVIYNRLENNIPLQVDVFKNSYKKNGLPKRAIASPSIAALTAACHPANVKDWFFYVADGKQHVFSQNFRDHNTFLKRRYHVH